MLHKETIITKNVALNGVASNEFLVLFFLNKSNVFRFSQFFKIHFIGTIPYVMVILTLRSIILTLGIAEVV
jgi:hypothetical protein